MPRDLVSEAASPLPLTGERVCFEHSPTSVALIAMGPSIIDFVGEVMTQELKPGWVDEVWAVNMASFAVRHDLVFWMDDLESQRDFRPGLIGLLKQHGKPVITSKRYPDLVPLSYDYPLQEVCDLSFATFGKPYLNNGVAMAVAYALWKGVKKLKIYGADFSYPNRNFAEQGRACVEAWATLCLKNDVKVEVSAATSLFDMKGGTGVYGYKEQPAVRAPDGAMVKYTPIPDGMGLAFAPEDSSGVA